MSYQNYQIISPGKEEKNYYDPNLLNQILNHNNFYISDVGPKYRIKAFYILFDYKKLVNVDDIYFQLEFDNDCPFTMVFNFYKFSSFSIINSELFEHINFINMFYKKKIGNNFLHTAIKKSLIDDFYYGNDYYIKNIIIRFINDYIKFSNDFPRIYISDCLIDEIYYLHKEEIMKSLLIPKLIDYRDNIKKMDKAHNVNFSFN
jgi:hypothetical protein